ncbi:right-handed parallel beta-helix repeat-containing protein [Natrarchaeobaculum aegyptiacum]|uniref:Cadherin domain-containing protein n=1 Tax=Natrarchaeobaculum aegyptiacum TaxID=745377 RepID=A0A2Z2HZG6_9EURY|nr:right-handed parallel beta-helix repeat-containing protein [Natrarchaeobaculum aegyptiacum]ARS91377.1 hypothetical protein B1756_17725 [Natrarchaeobaculum aegyptiacum]
MVTSIVAPVGAASASNVAADDSGGTFDAFTDDGDTVAGDDTTEATTASTHSSNESTDENEMEEDSSTLDTPESTTADSDEDSLEKQRTQDESDEIVGTQLSSSAEPITECRILDEPGEYELQNDLNSSSTCLQVEADGVTIDGNGHTITGDGSSDSYGIEVGVVDHPYSTDIEPWNVHVRDVTLEGWDNGLTARSVERLTVEGVTAENSASDGIRVRGGVGVEISEVKVTNNGGDGVSFGDVHDSTVEYVTASMNDDSGISFFMPPGDNPGYNTNVTVAHNVVTDNGQDFNGDGIRVTGDEIVVVNNTATGNDGNGIVDERSSVDNTYTHNTVLDNYGHGILVDYTTEGTVVEYTNATENTGSGIKVDPYAKDVTVAHNHLERNNHGVYVASGTDNWIENNTAVASSATGFRAENGASNTTFIDNRAIDNEQQGILIEGSSNDAKLIDNTIRGSGDRGVDVRGSDGVTLSGDTILDSGTWDVRAGDYLDSSTTGAEIENLIASDVTIGSMDGGEMTLDFVATDVAFGSVVPPSAPEDLTAVGRVLDVESHPTDGSLEITFHYEADDVDDPDTLGIWSHDGAEWSEIGGEIDTDARTATATTTEDGKIGLFGERDAEAPETGTLEGIVTGDSSPIEGATVTVTDDAGVTETVETDGTGSYELTVPVGTYELTVSADGYVDAQVTDLVVVEDGATENVELVEQATDTGIITGQVTTEDGNPVEWAYVQEPTTPVVDTTDSAGFYELELSPGTYVIDVFTEDVEPLTGSAEGVVVTESEVTTQDIVVSPASPDPDDPELEVSEASATPTELETGENVTITASVENVGDEDGELIVPLEVDGEVIDTETVELDVGNTTPVAFTHAFDTRGEYEVSVGGVDAGTVTVNAGPNLVVYGANVDEAAVELGEEDVVVSASLINTGGVEGTELVELRVRESGTDAGLRTVESESFNVTPGEIHSLELSWDPDADEEFALDDDDLSAEFDLYLGDLFVDTVSVEDRESDIQVIAALASTDEVVAGEEMYATGSIYQAGTVDDSQEIDLTAVDTENESNVTLATSEHSLEPGWYHLGAINETFAFEDPGTYEIFVGDRPAGTVEVIEAYSDIQVIAASASTDEIVAGEEEFYATGSIYQNGTIEGSETINLTAEHVESGNTTTVGTQDDVNLKPGFYHLGALNVSGTIEEPGTHNLTLGDRSIGTIEVIEAYSEIQVIAASASTDEIVAGEEEFYATGSIYQNGTVEGSETIELTAEHVETGNTTTVGTQKDVELAPGFYHLGALNVSGTIEEPGTHNLTLGDRSIGTIEVIESYSDIQVIAASASTDEIVAGEEEFYATGSIYQNGTIEGSETINLTAEHVESGNTTTAGTQDDVNLKPGFYHLGALNVSGTIEKPGTHNLTLGDRSIGTIEVTEAYSDIQVIAASADAMNVSVDEEFHVVGSIYQNGTIDGSERIALNATLVEDEEGNSVDDSEPFELGAQDNVELEPGYYHLGALNVSGTFDSDKADPGTYDLTLGDRNAGTISVEQSPSDIQVIAASLSEIEVLEDEQLNVTGSVYQNGTKDVEQTIELTAIEQTDPDEEELPLGNQTISLEAGHYHLGAIEIDFAIDEPGTYDLYLDDHSAGELEVIERYSDIEVIAASADADEVVAGEESFYTVGSIYQNGTIDGPEDVALNATPLDDGGNLIEGETFELASQEDVTLEPGFYHLGAVNISASFDANQTGTYRLDLGERYAGTVEVLPAASDIEVIAASASTDEIVAGEELYAVGSIYQNGTIAEPETFELTAEHVDTGETITLGEQADVELDPGFYHLGALNISGTIDEPGTYDLVLGDRLTGTVEVLPAESDIEVIAASVSADEVAVGESFYSVGSIYQNGTVDDPEDVALTATALDGDGVPIEGKTVELGVQEGIELTPGFYHLGALNISASFDAEQTGTYRLDLGDRSAGTIEVREPVVEPSIVDVDGHFSAIDPDFDERTATYANDDVTVELDVESDLPVEDVYVHVSSLQTNYLVEIEAEPDADGTPIVEIPIDDERVIPDDGGYDLSVIAVDEHGTVGTTPETELLVIDRDEPTMSVSIEDVTADDATVAVESDEPLSSTPSVSLDVEGFSTQSSTPPVELEATDATNTTFEGTLPFDGSGEYTVSVTGTDRAGNVVTDSTAVVHHEFTLDDGVIEIEELDVQVVLDVVDDVDEALLEKDLAMALAESATNANLDEGARGVGFLQTELPGLLEVHLESAEIAIPIDEDDDFPTGFEASDVELQHYDSQTDQWTTVEDAYLDNELGDDPYLVGTVPHFSTYGAVIPDETPPEITTVSPTDGTKYASDTDEVHVAFEYTDDLSGIDVSSVELEINGDLQTDPDVTVTNSTATTHTHTVTDGESYEVMISVADEAGNVANETVTFTVEEEDDSDDSDDSGGSGSSGGSSGSGGTGDASPTPTPTDPDDDGTDESDPDDEGDRDSEADDGTITDPSEDGDDAGTDASGDGASDDTDESPTEADDSPDDVTGDDDSIPGFGIVIALLVLAVLLSVSLRRRA